MTTGLVLLAGGTGSLGRKVVREFARRGRPVRLLTRSGVAPAEIAGDLASVARGDLGERDSLARAMEGVDEVFSCAGASMDLYALRDRRSFDQVDYRGNLNLLQAARHSGCKRFTYVSVVHNSDTARTAYVAAHEGFSTALRQSGLDYRIVRPTGFFSFFGEVVRMVRRGRVVLIGDGSARTNPIAETDLAHLCLDSLSGETSEISAGGPDVFTRREIGEIIAFQAAGRPARFTQVPPAFFRALCPVVGLVNPRIAGLLEFGAAVSTTNCTAPSRGEQRLADYFRTELSASAPR